jgi:hypothetical protein
MAEDHYVAQTYLKHWSDPQTNKIRGYKKASDENFPCSPKDVCSEWNWDINPLLEDNPALLADFRKMFEPYWNPTIGRIRSGLLSSHDKFALAGYWAQLTTCTPTWLAQAVEVYERKLLDFIPVAVEHVARQRPQDREYIERAVAEGRITPDVKDGHVKAILTQQLTSTIILLYQMDWVVLMNATSVPFITSDNPSSVFPRRTLNAPLVRFLPLAPNLALLGALDRKVRREELSLPDLSKPPPGTLRRWIIDRRKGVARLNRVTIMNADRLIFAPTESRAVRRLVRNHRRFGIAADHVQFQMGGNRLSVSTLVVRQKPR